MRRLIAAVLLLMASVGPTTEEQKTRAVVDNDQRTGYLTRIRARLEISPRAGKPTFQNESQLLGPLALEMSHVALRDGTHEASKAVLLRG